MVNMYENLMLEAYGALYADGGHVDYCEKQAKSHPWDAEPTLPVPEFIMARDERGDFIHQPSPCGSSPCERVAARVQAREAPVEHMVCCPACNGVGKIKTT